MIYMKLYTDCLKGHFQHKASHNQARRGVNMNKLNFLVFAFLAVIFVSTAVLADVPQQPIGPDELEIVDSGRHPIGNAITKEAYAGNVTELTVSTVSSTLGWQGYFGDVSGTITLDDASNNTMYNWALANPAGEIYASLAAVSDWDLVSCATPLNISYHENTTYHFNTYPNGTLRADQDVDGIEETFNNSFTGDFYVGSTRINSTSGCSAAYLFVNDAYDNAGTFTETLLYDATAQNLVFTSILQENSAVGFDSLNHDFQMLVAEDGHNGDETTTTYYFYVEIQ
jgi:hypothetical protein